MSKQIQQQINSSIFNSQYKDPELPESPPSYEKYYNKNHPSQSSTLPLSCSNNNENEMQNFTHINALHKNMSTKRRNLLVKYFIMICVFIGVFGILAGIFSITDHGANSKNKGMYSSEQQQQQQNGQVNNNGNQDEGKSYGMHRQIFRKQNRTSLINNNNIKSQQKIIKKIFNPQNSNKTFGQLKQFGVKIKTPRFKHDFLTTLKQNDIYTKIQVGSHFDYTNLSKTVNFTKLHQQLSESIAYQQYNFVFDDSLQKQPQELQLNKFNSNDNIKDQQKYKDLGLDINDPFFEINLGALIVRSPQNNDVKEAQYRYYDVKYGIGSDEEQLPLCVHATGYKIFSKNRYAPFFQSLQRQNYTNFHIVYIDDNSPPQQTQSLLLYLQNQNYRLNNRLTIVHTTQHLGSLANMHFFMHKYCKPNEIIVNVDADDALVGHQTLKVVNNVYKDQQTWFAYSRYILTEDPQFSKLSIGFSTQLLPPAAQYRNEYQYWNVSHMRTFRKSLLQKIPLYMVMEYHLNQSTKMAYPAFYSFASDTFHIFNMLEMTGDTHYRYLTDCLYLYYGAGSNTAESTENTGKNCYTKHQKFDDFKSRIKTPLKMLDSLQGQGWAQQRDDYAVPDSTWETFKIVYQQYYQCVNA